MSVRRNVLWAFSGQFASAVIGFGSSIIIARLLTPYEFGLNAVAVAMSGILSVLAASGGDAFIVREANLTEKVIATATTVNAILFSILSLVMLAISFAAEPLLGDERAGEVIRILAIMPLLNILTFRPAAMLQREMRFKAVALVMSFSIIINNAVTICAILFGASYISPALGAVSGVLAALFLYIFINPSDLKITFSFNGIRRMALFGLRMVSISGAAQFVQHGTQLILGRILGIDLLGLYSRATLLANFLFSQFYGTAARITFAQMSKISRETGEIKQTYLRSFYIIVSVLWPIQLGLAILSRPIMTLLYGERWVGAAAPFSVLMVTQIVALGFALNWELFVIRDRVAVQTRYEFIRVVVGISAFSVGCIFGMTAAAFGRLVEALVAFALYLPWMGRLSGASGSEISSIHLRSGALALVAVAPLSALMLFGGWGSAPPLSLLGAGIALGAIGWVALLYVMSHPLLYETRAVLSAGAQALRISPFSLRRLGQPDAAAAPQPEERMPIDERF